MELFIGNLPYDMTESDLRNVFSRYGKVSSVTIPADHFTGKPKGHAYVKLEPLPKKTMFDEFSKIQVKGRILDVEAVDINYLLQVFPDGKKPKST
jgi:RNA recognition motif-containing protein